MQDDMIEKTHQDRELILENLSLNEGNKPQVKECSMKVAAVLICDVIEKYNRF